MPERFYGGSIIEQGYDAVELNREKINYLLEQISEKMNAEFGLLVDKECRVNMRAFLEDGFYTEEKLMLDEWRIKNNKEQWSGADDEDTDEGKEKAIKDYEKELEKSENVLFEKVVNILLYKILNKEFIVVRTSLHDDQKNGVDHFLADKDTGNIICGVDAVESNNINRKKEKVTEKNEEGGAKIEYGAAADKKNGGGYSLTRKSFEHVPVFYLGASRNEFRDLLAGMNNDLESSPASCELTFYEKMIKSLETQREEMLNDVNIKDEIKDNLKNLEMPLARMKGIKFQRFGYD